MNRPTGAASLLTLLFPTPAERSPGEAAELTKQDKSIDTLIGDRARAQKQ